MRPLVWVLLFAGLAHLALPACGPVAGNSYYVSSTGDDLHPCSAGQPCRQIRKALTLVQPGDTIFVADGVYLGFTVADLNGVATNWITVKATGSNAYVQATTDRADNRDNIFVSSCSYLVFDGLNATNAPRAGMRIDDCQHVTVRNGRFGSNTVWGIFTDFSDDLIIEDNECYANTNQHGIYFSNSGDRPIIRGNYCHDNWKVGIHMNGDLSSGGDGLITGAIVENNLIVNNGTQGGAGINMDGVQDSIIRNNVLIGNHATGIVMFQIDGAQGPRGNQVHHNTVDQAADARWAFQISDSAGPNTVRNNIFNQRNNSAARGCINYATAADIADSDYNILTGNAYISTNDAASRLTLTQWKAAGHDAHSSSNDIVNLVVAPFSDYHLKAGSPAINAGQTLAAVLVDHDNFVRPAGITSDIGAYEFGSLLAAPAVTVTLLDANACLSLQSLAGKLYQIEGSTNLMTGWNTVTNAAGTGDSMYFSVTGGGTGPKRFYRVRISPLIVAFKN